MGELHGGKVSMSSRVRGSRRWALTVALVSVAVVASGCAILRNPIPGTSGIAQVVVGAPGVAGARTVDISVPGLAPGTTGQVTVRVDRTDGPPAVQGHSVPGRVVLPGAAVGPGDHTVFVKVKVAKHYALGVARVSGSLRLNQLQALGTHNSYHVAPTVPPFSTVGPWQYTHPPLDVQFETQGIRQIELDVYADPTGIRVLHITDADTGSTCPTLVVCLQTVKAWSDAHPLHIPIAIQIELKDDYYGGPTPVLPWDGPALDQLDSEIRSVLAPADMITPDDVRGTHATLPEAISTDGWPTLDASRGKVLFTMDNDGVYRDRYRVGHPVLEGRVIFTNSTVGQPDGAFVKLNNPVPDQQSIRAAVAAGYVVRTMADGDTAQARTNDTTDRDAALVSGATWVSTDYPVPGNPFGTPYFVSIPGGTPARCNPINAPVWCTSTQIEHLP